MHVSLEDDKDEEKVELGKMRELNRYLEELLDLCLFLCIKDHHLKPLLIFQLDLFCFFAVSNLFVGSSSVVLVLGVFSQFFSLPFHPFYCSVM